MKKAEVKTTHVVRGILTRPDQPKKVLIGLGKAYKWEIPGSIHCPEEPDPVRALATGLAQELGPDVSLREPRLFRRLTEQKAVVGQPPQLWFVDFYTAELQGQPRIVNPQELRRFRWVDKRGLDQIDPRKVRYAHADIIGDFLDSQKPKNKSKK